MKHPMIIQGGMGVGVSDWRLAQAVARLGELGVVSGTGMNTVLVRRLQDGDRGGHMRRAMTHFPVPALAEHILDRYYIAGGKPQTVPYKLAPMYTATPGATLQALTVVATFVEVWLAKEGHDGLVGINLMEKIQLPNLASLYGAMLAGVDYVLMGAGIPRDIPAVLDRLAQHAAVSLKLHVAQAAPDDEFRVSFDPRAVIARDLPPLTRPYFLAIIASATLGMALVKKATGRIDGFVIEGPTAGGHNAPPRSSGAPNAQGEPVYGPKDVVDLAQIRALGLPFWLAGSYADSVKLQQAREAGAQGVQVGTAFALCEESGLRPDLRQALIDQALSGETAVFTDPSASPTGFPFKVARLPGTLADPALYAQRARNCDLGYLRTAYKKVDGTLGFRCPAEPVETYLAKGGQIEETNGRKCLCNGLMANVGLPQQRDDGAEELPLVTIGDDVKNIARFLQPGARSYTAGDVVAILRADVADPAPGVSAVAHQ